MDKIYKIYWNGKKAISEELDCVPNQYSELLECSTCHVFKDDRLIAFVETGNLNSVIEYSLGNIVSYTFDKWEIERLKEEVVVSLKNYHSDKVIKKQREIEAHEEMLHRLFYWE